MITHKKILASSLSATLCMTAITSSVSSALADEADAFENAHRPISNPTLFDLALPRTTAHAIYMHQKMPSMIRLASGAKVGLGGSFDVYALQLEYALNDRFSVIATKDGYVDFNPDNKALFSSESGYANIAAGVKYAFILDPVEKLAVSGSLVVEFPTGDDDVWQGTGEGSINLSTAALKLVDDWQFAGALGVHLPFDDDAESTTAFASVHASYNFSPCLYALAELNWFSVLSEGDGDKQFNSQAGGAVPALSGFEGGDLINLGASSGGKHGDIVTAAVGLRYKFSQHAELGVAYEIPLTDEEENLMESRITVDLVITF